MTTQAILSSVRMTCVTFQLAGAGGILPIYLSEEKEEKEEEWGGPQCKQADDDQLIAVRIVLVA